MNVFKSSLFKTFLTFIFLIFINSLQAQINPETERIRFDKLDSKSKLNEKELREMLNISDHSRNYDLNATLEFLNKAQKHFEQQQNYFFMTEYAEKISLAYMMKGEPEKGIAIVNELSDQYKSKFTEDEWMKIQLIQVRFLEEMNQYDQALKLINKLLPQTQNDFYLAALYSFRGGINTEKSNYDVAAEDYFNALRLYKKTGSEPNMITTYNRLGLLNDALNDFPKSLRYYQRALSLATKNKSEYDLNVLYLNLGNLYQKVDSLDKALFYYDKNLKLLEQSNNLSDIAKNLLNRGNIHLKLKNYEQAFENFKQSLKICKEMGIDFGKMHNYVSLGKAYTETKEYRKAIPMLDSALYYAKNMEIKTVEMNAYYSFSDVYEILGDYKKAYQYYTKYHELEKEVLNEEKQKTLSELEIKYETELKDQKINQINQSLETKKAQNGLLILGVIFLILIAGFIIFFLIYRNRTLKQLYIRNVELMNSFQFKAPEEKFQEIVETPTDHEDHLKKIFDRILLALEKEKIYTNPNLSLSDTSDYVKSNDKYVSAAIAENSNMNYSNFINFYRINEAKRLIYEDSNLSLNEIMQACGFHSRTTFYNAFKKHTGLSPKQFKEMGENNVVFAS